MKKGFCIGLGLILLVGVVGAQSGPYSAQIQRAIASLLSTNRTITGTWTVSASNISSNPFFDSGADLQVVDQSSNTNFNDFVMFVGALFNTNSSAGGALAANTEVSAAQTGLYLNALQGRLIFQSGGSWSNAGVWGSGIRSDIIQEGTGSVLSPVMNYLAYTSGNGGTFGPVFQYYGDSLSAPTGTTALNSANRYYLWFDEVGVFRIRSDNTFNAVYQAIPSLYNPQYRKYTPGAAAFERGIPGEWESNIYVVTTEKGPTQTLTSVTSSGTAATATLVGHGYATGDSVTIAGANQPNYNGTFTVTVTSSSVFTYTCTMACGASPATGVITAQAGALRSMRLGDASVPVIVGLPGTVAALPTCNAGNQGAQSFVTNANATTFASTVAGGGANKVPVVCDGTNWIIG